MNPQAGIALFNPRLFEEHTIAQLQNEFNTAQPYRHIVIDNFLQTDFAEKLYEHFPPTKVLRKHYDGINERKAEGANFEDFHPDFSRLREALMSPAFYAWVSRVTGIQDVFITNDHLGVGLHEGDNGSFLDVHIDFNIHPEKDVHRRLNLLIYMNRHWEPHYGGDLELWNAEVTECVKKVPPAFNRAVIFETSEISYHGYSRIQVPEGMSRKSVYAYFYTTERADAVPYHDTIFKARPQDSTVKKLVTPVKERLKNSVKAALKKVGIVLK